MAGGKSILVPQFSAEIVAKLLRTKRPNVLVGVPTLFDALTRDPSLARADLSCLTACFCGADTLPRAVKERFEAMVAAGGGQVKLLEGYGLTEAVTGIMATPLDGVPRRLDRHPVPRHAGEDREAGHHRGGGDRGGGRDLHRRARR